MKPPEVTTSIRRFILGLALLFLMIPPPSGVAAGTFDFVVKTTQANESFVFYTENASGFAIDWGDGSPVESGLSGSANRSHAYAAAGIYTNRVSGQAKRIAFGGVANTTPLLLRDIVSRLDDGVTGITSAYQMFQGAVNITAFSQADWFDASSGNVTTMERMFSGATAFNQDIGQWDVNKVTTMEYMFNDASAFNKDIGAWNVSSVNTMRSLFANATAFNNGGSDAIKNWDVTGVKSAGVQQGMRDMFRGTAFNQPIGDWNVSNVVIMSEMFRDSSFNQYIGNWDTRSLKYVSGMFYRSPFNQDISTKVVHAGEPGEYIAWDVSKVTSFANLFLGTPFNQNIGNWDVSGANSLSSMFESNSAFDQDISTKEVAVGERAYTAWDVSRITSMAMMFRYSYGFTRDISNWVVTNVTDFTQFMNSVPYPTSNYDKLLVAWSRRRLQQGVAFSGGAGKYSLEGAGGRVTITNNFAWRFTDGGLVSLAEYPVETATALQGCAMHPDKKYKLAARIDLSETLHWNDGAGFWPIGTEAAPFTGTFDGQGLVLSGLRINRPTLDGVGLFGKITGTVKKLGLTGTVCGNNQVGGVFGALAAGGVVEDCYARVAVTAAADDCHRGGFGGRNVKGAVRRVYATGAVLPLGGINGGGLVGSAESGDTYADEDTFWDMQASAWATSAMGTGKASGQMKNIETFVNWDIANSKARLNDHYPYLSGLSAGEPVWLILYQPGTCILLR